MWISKKKYNELIAQRDDFNRIATDAVTQNGRLLDEWDAAIKEMKGIQEFNHRLVRDNDELLTRVKELEAELQGTRQYSQQWAEDFEELDIAYGQLEIERDKLREERDHYEGRCRYLEGEMGDKEELEAELDFVIKQRDYYYDLLENTSEVEEKDE